MGRRVFFSFHYQRDVMRIMQVRNSWVVRAGDDAQPFYDAAEFEQAQRRAGGIENWIEEQLRGTSVTVVLFGAETSERHWVRHEIQRSVALNKGLLAIDIHRVKDPRYGTDIQGLNPLNVFLKDGVPLDRLYRTYDWVLHDGYTNMPVWIEEAARAAGR